MSTEDRERLVNRIEERLKRASRGDRAYERPMTWEEADTIIAYVRDLEAPARVARVWDGTGERSSESSGSTPEAS